MSKKYEGLHIRTWWSDDANYIYDKFNKGEYTVEDIIKEWNNGLGESDSEKMEYVNTGDFDNGLFFTKDYKYAVGFSNMDDDKSAACDIFEVEEKEVHYGYGEA